MSFGICIVKSGGCSQSCCHVKGGSKLTSHRLALAGCRNRSPPGFPGREGGAGLGGVGQGVWPPPGIPSPAGHCLHRSYAWSLSRDHVVLSCTDTPAPATSSPAPQLLCSCPSEQPRPSQHPEKWSARAKHLPLVPPAPVEQGDHPLCVGPGLRGRQKVMGGNPKSAYGSPSPQHSLGVHMGTTVPELTDATRPGWVAEGCPWGPLWPPPTHTHLWGLRPHAQLPRVSPVGGRPWRAGL